MKHGKTLSLMLASSLVATTLLASANAVPNNPCGAQPCEPIAPAKSAPGFAPGDVVKDSEIPTIPNAPLMRGQNRMLTLSAVGMGVAPEKTISPAHALAMAKRAAIIDGYRQLGEKLHGVRLNGQETVKNMIMTNSTVQTKLNSLLRNANVVESTYEDGLFQVKMEVVIDGKRWYRILAGRNF